MLIVRGWASTENIDRDGDIIASEAFAESVRDYLTAGGVVLYNHNKDLVIGKCTAVNIVPGQGLWVEAEIFTKDEDILTAIRSGALRSFSVGFLAKNVDVNQESGGLVYEKGDLLEISVVSVPANPQAIFEIVKNDENDESLEPQPQEAEKGLDRVGGSGVVFKNIHLKKQNSTKEKEGNGMDVKGFEEKAKDVEEMKSIEEAVEKALSQEKVEKAVNTLAASPQFQTVAREFIFDGLPEGRMFYVPNLQVKMTTSMVQVPILGGANVFVGESGATGDSDVGTNSITLTAIQYTARYPLSYLLESVGGDDLVKALEANLKKSIARQFDLTAYNTLSQSSPVVFDFANVQSLIDKITGSSVDYSEPSNCAIIANQHAYSWLMKQNETFTMQTFGTEAVIKTGAVGKILGMDVYMVTTSESTKKLIVLNKDYIASGQFGDIAYVKMINEAGTTYIIAKALLAFNKANAGGVLVLSE